MSPLISFSNSSCLSRHEGTVRKRPTLLCWKSNADRKCPKVSNPCFNGFVSLWPRRRGCANMQLRSRITNATFWSTQTAISETEITENLKGHKLESRDTVSSAWVVPVSPPTSISHWKYQQVNISRKTARWLHCATCKKLRKKKIPNLS
jgi:hypothetical protein